MPDYLKRVGRDVTDDILVRVPESEKHIARLNGPAFKRLGIDRGSIPSVAAPLEGQMMLQYDDEAVGSTPVSPDVGATFNGESPYYYSNGEWRPFATTFNPNPSSAQYQFDAGVVAALDVATVSWTFDLGDSALLDLTNPQAPVPVIEGVYAVMVELTSPDATWTPGNNLVVKLTAFGPLVNHHMEGSGTFDTTADPTHTRANAYVVAQMTATPGGSFGVDVENEDSVGHNLIGHISVQRILVY
jgi:hypothetical protein